MSKIKTSVDGRNILQKMHFARFWSNRNWPPTQTHPMARLGKVSIGMSGLETDITDNLCMMTPSVFRFRFDAAVAPTRSSVIISRSAGEC